jgi:hypothetical protein
MSVSSNLITQWKAEILSQAQGGLYKWHGETGFPHSTDLCFAKQKDLLSAASRPVLEPIQAPAWWVRGGEADHPLYLAPMLTVGLLLFYYALRI